jgi:hypothetical protein
MQTMDGLPKSMTSVVDFVSKGKIVRLRLHTEKMQGCISFSSQ